MNANSSSYRNPLPACVSLFLLSVLLIPSSVSSTHAQTGAVHGRVLEGDRPIIAARVTMRDQETGALVQETFTDNDGGYKFENVPANRTYTLTISQPPVFRDQLIVINIRQDEDIDAGNLVIERASVLPGPPIRVPFAPIFFAFKSTVIDVQHKAFLEQIALRMNVDLRAALIIDTHRDSSELTGISLNRAFNARDILVNRGLDPQRLVIRNFSATCPHDSGFSMLNARIEYWLLPTMALELIAEKKECIPGAAPQVLTNETPVTLTDPSKRKRARRKQAGRSKNG